MRRIWLCIVVFVFCLGFVAGCGTLRGATALIGGMGSDNSQTSQYIRDHTADSDAPQYQGVQQ